MSKDQRGIDLEKVRVIQNCLTNLFHDLHIGGEFLNLFAFTNGTQTGQLIFHCEYLDTLHPIGSLKLFMESTVMLTVLANPNMRIEVGADGALTVSNPPCRTPSAAIGSALSVTSR